MTIKSVHIDKKEKQKSTLKCVLNMIVLRNVIFVCTRCWFHIVLKKKMRFLKTVVYETVKLYFKRLVSCFAETNNAKHNVREFVRDVRELFSKMISFTDPSTLSVFLYSRTGCCFK